ncbi:MAG: phosphoribosylamine--glycine ligase [Gammaproteobacteria bacterium]
MKILIVGSGAREHALAKALQRSPQQPTLFCCATSHNPGIASIANQIWIGDINQNEEIVRLAKEWEIDFAIIGPEAPLEKGLADALWKQNIPVIGPKQGLAQLETSKAFTRDLLKKYHIPGSPQYKVFHNLEHVDEFLQQLGEGYYVIKANGLMGGKGVKVAGDHLHSFAEAKQFCAEILAAGQSFVIEEKVIGQEFSLLCFCDGETLISMPAVQDHKRAFINDEGPNTGGMGSYSDANHRLPFLTVQDIQEAQKINEAVVKAVTAECGEKYIGILYGSFMATKSGIRLIEYNARFGDPEAMNVLAILETDLVAIFQAMLKGKLAHQPVSFASLATVCKYAVPNGYPDQPVKNVEIDVSKITNPDQLYFAAVDLREDKLYATGSRTAAIVGVAPTLAEAEKIAEAEIQLIKGPLFHRADIGTENLIRRRVRHMQELRQCVI